MLVPRHFGAPSAKLKTLVTMYLVPILVGSKCPHKYTHTPFPTRSHTNTPCYEYYTELPQHTPLTHVHGAGSNGLSGGRKGRTRLHVQQVLDGELREAYELDGQVVPRGRRQVFRGYLGKRHLNGNNGTEKKRTEQHGNSTQRSMSKQARSAGGGGLNFDTPRRHAAKTNA